MLAFSCSLSAPSPAPPCRSPAVPQLALITEQAAIRVADERFDAFIAEQRRLGRVVAAADSAEAARAIELVQRVSNRIIDASGLRGGRQWEIVVVRHNVANAFVLPNGKIVIHAPLLAITQDDAGLAAVLGHEVGHVAARHGIERVSQALLLRLGILTAQIVVGAKDARLARTIGDRGSIAARFGIELPFNRSHESEADRLGLIYMARAGYGPAPKN